MTKNYEAFKQSINNLRIFIIDNLNKEVTFSLQAEFNALYNEYSNQLEIYSEGKIDDAVLKSIESLHDPLPDNIQDKYLDLYDRLENGFYSSAPTLFAEKN